MLDQPTDLYRYFDCEDNLLYVGISLNAVNRLREHKHGKSWSLGVETITIERYKTRKKAIDAELWAIKKEKPKYNIVGRFNEIDEQREQQIEELVAFLKEGENPDAAIEVMISQITVIMEAADLHHKTKQAMVVRFRDCLPEKLLTKFDFAAKEKGLL
jgi:predicted GIY-YIG superfamily endonuclease